MKRQQHIYTKLALLLLWSASLGLPACNFYYADCRTQQDCASGESCMLGWCQNEQLSTRLTACGFDGGCPAQYTCFQGYCIGAGNPTTCDPQGPKACREGYECYNGRCAAALCQPANQSVSVLHQVQPDIASLALHPSGRWAAWVRKSPELSIVDNNVPTRNELRIWDLQRQRLHHVIFLEQATTLQFLPHQKNMIAVISPKKLEVWSFPEDSTSPETSKMVGAFQNADSQSSWESFLWASDGASLAVLSKDTLEIWSVDPSSVSAFSVVKSFTRSEGMRVLYSEHCWAFVEGTQVRVWSLADKKEHQWNLDGPATQLVDAGLAGDALAILRTDGSPQSGRLQVFTLPAGTLRWETQAEMLAQQPPRGRLAFSSKGALLAMAGADQLAVWNAVSGQKQTSKARKVSPSLGIFFAEADSVLLDVGAEKSEAWSIANAQDGPLATFSKASAATFVSATQQVVLIGENNRGLTQLPFADRLWAASKEMSPPDNKESMQWAFPKNQPNALSSVTPDGVLHRFAWQADGKVNVSKSTFLQPWFRTDAPVTFVRMSPDGRWIAVQAYNDQTQTGWMRLWDVEKGDWNGTPLYKGTGKLLKNLVFREDSAALSGVFQDTSEVVIWSTLNNKQIFSRKPSLPQGVSIQAVALAPKGDRVAVALTQEPPTVEVWQLDASQTTKLTPKEPFAPAFRKIQFSPDGRWLAVITKGERAHVFDMTTSQQTYVFPFPNVLDVSFRADSEVVICAAADSVLAWRLSDGEPLLTLYKASPEQPQNVLYHPQSESLVVGTQAGILRLWTCAEKTTSD
ncbi:MAG: WD40 repeat domain-containing protein [Myxococcales bacterium]|nr:WD40 repeat domain-containing protein [Myxococcales bacterium]